MLLQKQSQLKSRRDRKKLDLMKALQGNKETLEDRLLMSEMVVVAKLAIDHCDYSLTAIDSTQSEVR